MINYIFRKPKFPVVYENNNNLIGGKTEKGFEIKLANLNIPSTSPHDVIDATGEVWFLSTDPLVLAPLTFKKRCTKKRLIDSFSLVVVWLVFSFLFIGSVSFPKTWTCQK